MQTGTIFGVDTLRSSNVMFENAIHDSEEFCVQFHFL